MAATARPRSPIRKSAKNAQTLWHQSHTVRNGLNQINDDDLVCGRLDRLTFPCAIGCSIGIRKWKGINCTQCKV